jgi:hypothetical protein
MALNSSGPISLAGTTAGVSIENELGGNGTTQISLNDSSVRTLAGVASGAITMPTNFWGKSNFPGNYFVNSFTGSVTYNIALTTYARSDSSGNSYLFGQYQSSPFFVKYDSTGAFVTGKYALSGLTYFNFFHIDSSGNMYGANQLNPLTIIKYNSTGTLQWARYLNWSGAGTSGQLISSVVGDSSGNIYIFGAYVLSSVYYTFVTKLDTTGATVWTKVLSLGSVGIYTAEAGVDASGNLWILSATQNNALTYSTIITKLDSTGAIIWSKIISGVAITAIQKINPVSFDSSGNAWFLISLGSPGYCVIAISPSGSVVYAYNAGASNVPTNIYVPSTGSGYFYTTTSNTGIQISQPIYKYNISNGASVAGYGFTPNYNQGVSSDYWYVGSAGGDTLVFGSGDGRANLYLARLPSDGTYLGTYLSAASVVKSPPPNMPVSVFVNTSSTQPTLTSTSITLSTSSVTVSSYAYTLGNSSVSPGGTTFSPANTAYTSLSGVNTSWGSATYLAGTATYSWIAPTGVTSVSVVAIGSGSAASRGGGGGGLGYKNNYSVTPGNSYTVRIAGRNTSLSSYFVNTSTVAGNSSGNNTGGTYVGDGGGNGGTSTSVSFGGGGGGGYSGSGGGGINNGNGTAGSGGGGGGGNSTSANVSGGGGGVSVLGQGTSGAGGTPGVTAGGGSGGMPSSLSYNCPGCSCPCYPNPAHDVAGDGGNFGGGSSGSNSGDGSAGGAVRIVWPGSTRTFPSTNVGSP